MKTYIVHLTIILSLTVNIFSQVEFTTHIITPGDDGSTTDGAAYVYAIDVDGDGDMDILSASGFDDKVAWYENDGDKNFNQHIITNAANGAVWLYAIDMDGDGDIDVLSASVFDDTIAWYENDGNQNFTTHIISSGMPTSGLFAFSVYAIDVEGDGDIDVFSGSWDKNEIKWHENDGNQNFTTHIIANQGQRSSVYAIDVDGDGDNDALSASQFNSTVAWYEYDNQNFTTHVITNTASHARTVKAIDLDEDGDIDVLAGCWQDNIEWYENDGDQNFTIHTLPNSTYGSGSIDVADVDNDGDLDILSTIADLNMVAWLENDGDENFTLHVITTNARFADTVYGADVDGDGDIDVLSAARDGDEIAWYENHLINPPTSISNFPAIPLQFSLHQNYPNPFNPATTIAFTLSQPGFVSLTIYNVSGEKVTTLISESLAAGSYQYNWNAGGLASGVYFYQLQTDKFTQTKKLVLLR